MQKNSLKMVRDRCLKFSSFTIKIATIINFYFYILSVEKKKTQAKETCGILSIVKDLLVFS